MFGHIKKVYVDSSGESGDVWLQASSGMYLLPFENVAPDYKDELVNFLMTNGVKSASQHRRTQRASGELTPDDVEIVLEEDDEK